MKMASVIAIVCFELPHSLHLIHLTVPGMARVAEPGLDSPHPTLENPDPF